MAIETIKTDVSVKYTKNKYSKSRFSETPQSDNTVQARDLKIYMGAAKIRIVGAPEVAFLNFHENSWKKVSKRVESNNRFETIET